jgi:minichromosome maintenance protein 10
MLTKATANDNWPPKSPHDVLLSTPGGRDKLRRLAERGSPSPSPIKRSNSLANVRSRSKDLMKRSMELDDTGDEDDDDEETLQLQLQEIQARLRLKKLQKKAKQSSDTENDYDRAGSAPLARSNSAATSRAQSRISDSREERLGRSRSQASVHVPVSPVRRVQPVEPQRSPGRVLLGIDKGLKGSDISLKRAPSLRKTHEDLKGPFLQRSGSQASSRSSNPTTLSQLAEDQPRSFSSRMAAMRTRAAEREERDIRIKKTRSTAFDINHEEMQRFKDSAVELPPTARPAPEFSREEVLSSYNKPTSSMPRSKTAPNLRSAMRDTSNASGTNVSATQSESRASVDTIVKKDTSSTSKTQPSDMTESEASEFEPYSSLHLSKRIIPHKELTRIFRGKKTFSVPDLLRDVKAPDFSGPDIDEDVVVFAVIAEKSDPKVHQNNAKNENRGKFMIMTLTDLKWEVELFLFNSAFDKFWKFTPGTIIAILNPGFMPPPRGKEATGKFSLTLNSDADTILEIGSARDLGFCKSVKKDGKVCDSWVNKRHTEFCNYHVNVALEKTHSKRMEVNTMTFGKGRGANGERKYNSKDMTGFFDRRREAKEKEKTLYDKVSHSQIYIGKRSTVNMLDDVDYDPDAFHRGSTKEERLNRRIQEKEKERELQKKLGMHGGGQGANYMRKQNSSHTEPNQNTATTDVAPPDAAALGLLSSKGKDIQLSPIKRKRTNTLSSTAAVGWGGNLTKELGRMKNGESLQPVKKKTRFVTEKGIREAGRESFGGEVIKAAVDDLDDDDDDDLDIVRE